MGMNDENIIKLINFIIKNKDTITANNSVLSKNTLAVVKSILYGKYPKNYIYSDNLKKLLIKSFILANRTFDDDTPYFIINDEDAIKVSIKNDINSVRFVKFLNSNASPLLKDFIINEAVKQNYILSLESPDYLSSNTDVILNSVKLDVNSANYIDWDDIETTDTKKIINHIINCGYILNEDSHAFLSADKDVCISSLKKDGTSCRYIEKSILSDDEILKTIILNVDSSELNTNFIDYIKSLPLSWFDSPILLEKAMFFCYGYSRSFDKEYISRLSKLFYDSINVKPKIKDFEEAFYACSADCWKEYRNQMADLYDNVFGKICSEIRGSSDLEEMFVSLRSLFDQIESVLDNDTCQKLYDAAIKYYNCYHSNSDEKIDEYRDTISEISALYISKSKDSYIFAKTISLNKILANYFKLDLNNSSIYKKLVESNEKETFKSLYINNDSQVREFINNLVRKYSDKIDSKTILKMIDSFVICNVSKVDGIIYVPINYQDYERYEKAIKLINRLNSSFIKYDDIEVINYRDIISYDNNSNKYIYSGISFSSNDIDSFNEYRVKYSIFDKIKKEIIIKIKSMKLCNNINDSDKKRIINEILFNDKNFVYDEDSLLKLNLDTLNDACFPQYLAFSEESLLNDEYYNQIYNLLVDKRMGLLLLFSSLEYNMDLCAYGIEKSNIIDIINGMPKIVEFSKNLNFNINKISDLIQAYKLCSCTDNSSYAILGTEIVEKLCKKTEYTCSDSDSIIHRAKDLYVNMAANRNSSTVPYVNGISGTGYKYSIYDPLDESLLVAGIDTDACFKIDGNDNDFFYYCALNKNGFVIKITDEQDNFIGRAAGFRNGNCIFLNQLRTIYDQGGGIYNSGFENERLEIIDTLSDACVDILTIAWNEPLESIGIDFAFITQSYSLDCIESNVPYLVKQRIGKCPVNYKSKDWRDFVLNTDYLEEADIEHLFSTDYDNYDLICLADNDSIDLIPENLKLFKDPDAIYKRKRNEIIITRKIDDNIIKKINKIHAMWCHINDLDFEYILIPDDYEVAIGDNWFIIYNSNGIYKSACIDSDLDAVKEYNEAYDVVSNINELINNEIKNRVKCLKKANQ